MIFQLGQVVLDFKKNPIQSLEENHQGGWQQTSMLNSLPFLTKIGKGGQSSELTLSGELLMHGPGLLEDLKKMLDGEDFYELIDGEGNLLGSYAVNNLKVGHSNFLPGGMSRLKSVSITLLKNEH